MNNTQSLLRQNLYRVNDIIQIYIPTCGEIYDYGEDEYFNVSQLLTSVPYDLMVQFDDIDIDYETVSEYQLFLMLLESFKRQNKDLSILFPTFDICALHMEQRDTQKEPVLCDSDHNVVIDKLIQYEISQGIRKLHFWQRTEKRAGNKEAKQYLIERNRLKQKRAARKPHHSYLDEGIIKLVNTEEFPYTYEQCMDLSIYKFNASMQQIPKKKNWDQTMTGAYFGTVDLSKLNIEKIHWMSNTTS